MSNYDQENPVEPNKNNQTIRELIGELTTSEQKIIAALAVVGVATTGQIWRLARLEECGMTSRDFARRLITLCEKERLVGAFLGAKLPRQMQGKVVPETWYLTAEGVASAQEISPALARYAFAGMPCGDKIDRLGHELLVTESLLQMLKEERVIEFKPERILKRELVIERFRRARRQLNDAEVEQILSEARGEETGDFKIKVLKKIGFCDGGGGDDGGGWEIRELEGEAAVRYRGKAIEKKPSGMRWFTGSQAQADMVEANQPKLLRAPVVIGSVCHPFYAPEVVPYMGRRQHLDNYLDENSGREPDSKTASGLRELAADETLSAATIRQKLRDILACAMEEELQSINLFGLKYDLSRVAQLSLFNEKTELSSLSRLAKNTERGNAENVPGIAQNDNERVSATGAEASESDRRQQRQQPATMATTTAAADKITEDLAFDDEEIEALFEQSLPAKIEASAENFDGFPPDEEEYQSDFAEMYDDFSEDWFDDDGGDDPFIEDGISELLPPPPPAAATPPPPGNSELSRRMSLRVAAKPREIKQIRAEKTVETRTRARYSAGTQRPRSGNERRAGAHYGQEKDARQLAFKGIGRAKRSGMFRCQARPGRAKRAPASPVLFRKILFQNVVRPPPTGLDFNND